jgi:hypothetical protein
MDEAKLHWIVTVFFPIRVNCLYLRQTDVSLTVQLHTSQLALAALDKFA